MVIKSESKYTDRGMSPYFTILIALKCFTISYFLFPINSKISFMQSLSIVLIKLLINVWGKKMDRNKFLARASSQMDIFTGCKLNTSANVYIQSIFSILKGWWNGRHSSKALTKWYYIRPARWILKHSFVPNSKFQVPSHWLLYYLIV